MLKWIALAGAVLWSMAVAAIVVALLIAGGVFAYFTLSEPAEPKTFDPIAWAAPAVGGDPDVYRRPCLGPRCPQ